MLTAEIIVELTPRDVVLMKRGNAVGYTYLKPIVINEEEIPIEFTVRTILKGATEKARKKATRKKRG